MARSATFASIAVETVMPASLLVHRWRYRCPAESAIRLNKRERGELSVEARRQHAEAAAVVIGPGCIALFEVAPALVRAARLGRDGDQLGRADDIDAAVVAVLEAEDLLPS